MRGSTGNLTPPSRMAIKGKSTVFDYDTLNVDVALMTIGNINILVDVVSSPKSGQSGL